MYQNRAVIGTLDLREPQQRRVKRPRQRGVARGPKNYPNQAARLNSARSTSKDSKPWLIPPFFIWRR